MSALLRTRADVESATDDERASSGEADEPVEAEGDRSPEVCSSPVELSKTARRKARARKNNAGSALVKRKTVKESGRTKKRSQGKRSSGFLLESIPGDYNKACEKNCLQDAVFHGIEVLDPSHSFGKLEKRKLRTLARPILGLEQQATTTTINAALRQLECPFELVPVSKKCAGLPITAGRNEEEQCDVILNLCRDLSYKGVFTVNLRIVLTQAGYVRKFYHTIMLSTIPEAGAPLGKVRDDIGNAYVLQSEDLRNRNKIAEMELEIVRRHLKAVKATYTSEAGLSIYAENPCMIRPRPAGGHAVSRRAKRRARKFALDQTAASDSPEPWAKSKTAGYKADLSAPSKKICLTRDRWTPQTPSSASALEPLGRSKHKLRAVHAACHGPRSDPCSCAARDVLMALGMPSEACRWAEENELGVPDDHCHDESHADVCYYPLRLEYDPTPGLPRSPAATGCGYCAAPGIPSCRRRSCRHTRRSFSTRLRSRVRWR